jgi:hypothetical protein
MCGNLGDRHIRTYLACDSSGISIRRCQCRILHKVIALMDYMNGDKKIGLALALSSNIFLGISYIITKHGLITSEGHGAFNG